MEKLLNSFQKLFQKNRANISTIFLVLTSFLLISIFDSTISFLVPGTLLDLGYSEQKMGLIYSCSALSGIVFDLLLTKILPTTNFKRLQIYIASLLIFFPLLLFWGNSIFLILISMAVWALYVNLWNFSLYDFTSRSYKSINFATGIAIAYAFNDLGVVIGSLIASNLQNMPKTTLIGYLSIFPILLFLISMALKKDKLVKVMQEHNTKRSFLEEMRYVKSVIRRIWPVLLIWLTMITGEAMITVLTPIAQRYESYLDGYTGIAMALFYLPTVIVIPFIPYLSQKFSKKKAGILTFIIGSALLVVQGYAKSPLQYLLLSFISSCFYAIFYATIGGVFSDYLYESKSFDNEIQGIKDIMTNAGYVLGPILAGFLIFRIESIKAFSILGGVSLIVGVLTLLVTPRSIPMYDKDIKKEL